MALLLALARVALAAAAGAAAVADGDGVRDGGARDGGARDGARDGGVRDGLALPPRAPFGFEYRDVEFDSGGWVTGLYAHDASGSAAPT